MVLINSLDKKAINTAILALDDDIKKVSNTSSSSGSGITEGNTYNINISGNANTASKVKNALTLNVGGNATSYDGSEAKTVTIGSNAKLTVATTDTYTAASTTEYDGSTAKTATIYTPDQAVNKASSPTFAQITASYLFGSINTYCGAHASFTTNIKAETSSTGKAGVLFVCTTQHSGTALSMGLGIGIITFPYSLRYDQSLNVKWLYANAAGTAYNQASYWSFSLSPSQYLVATCSSTDGYCSITFL